MLLFGGSSNSNLLVYEMKRTLFLLVASVVFLPCFAGCTGGSTDTTEVETTTFDQAAEDRLKERENEQMSEADRRKANG